VLRERHADPDATRNTQRNTVMLTHHLSVPRTARYCVLGTASPDVREVWIVCHGYGQLAARFLSAFAPLDDGTRLLVAPEALSRFYLDERPGAFHAESRVGATWMTREDREQEIGDYVRYLDLLHGELFRVLERGRVSLVVVGFSQGVATVVRWTVLGAVRPDRIILWAGNLPPDLDPAAVRSALARTRLTLVAGNTDEFATAEAIEKQRAHLHELGVAFEQMRYDGGHHIEEEPLRRLVAP
jgi:predicted esterase